jgi:hypothetical protein
MGNIIINAAEFQCESPVIGTTYRNISSGGGYVFNWTSEWDNYATLGLNTQIRLFYIGDGQPEQLYTGVAIPLPGNANSLQISDQFGFYDQTDFRLVFDIDNGDTCSYTFNIPYSSIITI